MINEIDTFFNSKMREQFGPKLKKIEKKPRDICPTMHMIYYLLNEAEKETFKEKNTTIKKGGR